MSDHLTTEVIGFRQWKVDEDLRLTSAHMKAAWEKGDNTAQCRAQGYDPYTDRPTPTCALDCPGSNCDCGLYALHAPTFWYGQKDAQGAWYRSMMMGGDPPIYIAGLIAAWGKLQVHHDGFRAQHAKVVAIAIPEGKRDAAIARAVAAEYGVPTVPQNELERVASEFGNVVPEEFRPEKLKPAPDLFRQTYAKRYQQLAQPSPVVGYWQTYQQAAYSPLPPPKKQPKKGKKPRKSKAPELPEQAGYDPRAFLPKRHGGLR